MIYFLKGIIEEVGSNFIAIDVNGVGYQAFASSRTLSHLAVGEVTKLHIYTHVREAEFSLFGFSSGEERDTFITLTSVGGVGPKVGLAILSALDLVDIINAIAAQDGKTFTAATGVGPKLGDRIVLELKNKIGALPTTANGVTVHTSTPAGGVAVDVLSALVNLGYKTPHAQQALTNATEQLGAKAGFDELFKACLGELR